MVDFDLIVVGAGPGGAYTAKTVAEHGYRVLLLEKTSLPRYKPCGGGVTAKTQKLLEWPLKSISKNAVSKTKFYISGNHVLDADLGAPFVHLVDRAEFDYKLVIKASEKGVEIAPNEAFVSLESKRDYIVVQTPYHTYKSEFIVGADGPLSKVRKQLGINYKPVLGFTIEGEYYTLDEKLKWNDCIIIDLARPENPKGYNWIFPKGDIVSIGLGTFLPGLLYPKSLLNQYLQAREISDLQPFSVKGHHIPADGAVRKVLHCNLGIIVGDAAGLVDPFTGEGIYYAILSGKIAGEEIVRALRLNSRDLGNYSNRIYYEITRKLKWAATLSQLVYSHPQFLVKLLAADPGLLRKFLSVIYGNCEYAGLVFRLLTRTMFKTIIKAVN